MISKSKPYYNILKMDAFTNISLSSSNKRDAINLTQMDAISPAVSLNMYKIRDAIKTLKMFLLHVRDAKNPDRINLKMDTSISIFLPPTWDMEAINHTQRDAPIEKVPLDMYKAKGSIIILFVRDVKNQVMTNLTMGAFIIIFLPPTWEKGAIDHNQRDPIKAKAPFNMYKPRDAITTIKLYQLLVRGASNSNRTKDIQTNDGKSGQTFFNIHEGQAPLPLPNPVWSGHGGVYAYYLDKYQPIKKTCSNVYFSHDVPDFTCVYLTSTCANDGTKRKLLHAHASTRKTCACAAPLHQNCIEQTYACYERK